MKCSTHCFFAKSIAFDCSKQVHSFVVSLRCVTLVAAGAEVQWVGCCNDALCRWIQFNRIFNKAGMQQKLWHF